MYHCRPIERRDREDYAEMVRAFYATDAVIEPIPLSYIERTFDELMRSDVYAQAFMLEYDGKTAGYALLAKTFSQEAGGMVVWVEELYIKEDCRGNGIGSRFLKELVAALPDDVRRVRLEVERENERAVKLYESLGFEFFEYDQMICKR